MIKIIDQKGRNVWRKKRNMYQNSLIKKQNGNLFATLVFSLVFLWSYYQWVNAATKDQEIWDSTCVIENWQNIKYGMWNVYESKRKKFALNGILNDVNSGNESI